MPKLIDLSGKKFGYLKVIERAENTKHGEASWLCECKCGTKKIIGGYRLRKGITKSCGCLNKEMSKKKNKTHGMKGTRLYNIWQGIKQRTTNPNHHEYSDYGERGIDICEEWKDSFENFKKWSYENGYQDNLTIDRKNNDKGYTPDNCRWITIKEQQRNRRSNHCLTYKGETKTITEWSEITGLSKQVIRYRISKMKWDVEKTLTTPLMRNRTK